MHILITGDAGMWGRKLVERLAQDRGLGGHEISRMTLADLVPPEAPKHLPSGFDARSARVLGFVAENDFEQIIRAHIEDELEDRT